MEQNPIEHRLLYCTLEDIHYQFLYSAPSVYRPPRFIANLAYRQNSCLSGFHPLKIPCYTAKLSYCHRFSDTKVVKPILIPPLVPPTTTF